LNTISLEVESEILPQAVDPALFSLFLP
jgi:hypothetical protein